MCQRENGELWNKGSEGESHGFAGKTWGLFWGTGIRLKEVELISPRRRLWDLGQQWQWHFHTCHLQPLPDIMDSIPKFLVSHKDLLKVGDSFSPVTTALK